MPHMYADNIAVVTHQELLPFYNNSKSISVMAKRAEQRGYGLKRVRKGGNNHQALYDYDTLPPRIKDHIADPRKKDHILEKWYEVDHDAVEFYQNFQFEDETYLKDNIAERYITNASVLRACQRLKAERERTRISMGGSLKGVMTSLCEDAQSFNRVLAKRWDVEHTLPGHPVRFGQVFNRFAREGYASLISKRHGNQNSRKVDDITEQLLTNMFAEWRTKPSFSEVNRQYDAFLSGYLKVINRKTGEIYNPKAFRKIAPSTIYMYLNKWGNKVGTFTLRSGDRQKLMGRFKPYHSLQQPTFSGSIISIDDRQPPFEYEKGKRMWFYLGIDLASECYTVAVWGKSKEGIISEFYRQMVRNYVEWGHRLPWELEAERSLNSSFRDTFLKPGSMFQDVRIEANNARGKRIEQYFRPLRYGIEKKSEGWLARPFSNLESNEPGSAKHEYIAYDKLSEARLRDIEKWNNMPHSRHPELTRWEYFNKFQHKDLKPINWRGFLPHLGEHTPTSCNLGIIRMQRQEWLLGENGKIATGNTLIRLMEAVEGRNVDVYWLSGNDGSMLKALVYYNDRYICEALPKPVYNRARLEQGAEDMKARELMSSYVATIESYREIRKNEIKESVEDIAFMNDAPKATGGFRMPAVGREKIWPETHMNKQEVEVLPQPDEDDLTDAETGFKTNLKDRF